MANTYLEIDGLSGGGGGAAPVDSVNGQTGVVVLTTDEINEGATNEYYTEAKVSANADVAAATAHLDGGANKHDADQIDVEGTLDNAPSAPADLETVLGELDSNLQSKFVEIVSPTGVAVTDIANIEAAVAAADAAGGGLVLLEEGTFALGATGLDFGAVSGVTLEGKGDATTLEINSVNGIAMQFTGTLVHSNKALNNYNDQAASVFTTLAGDAGLVQAGDVLILRGTDSVTGLVDAEYNVAAGPGVGGTGEIPLEYRTTFTMTAATISVYRGCSRNRVANMKIVETGGTTDNAIGLSRADRCKVENVTFEGTGTLRLGAVRAVDTSNLDYRECRVLGLDRCSGIDLSTSLQIRIADCDFRGLNRSGFGGIAGVLAVGTVNDVLISGCGFYDIRGDGAIHADQTTNSRVEVSNCTLIGIDGAAIRVEGRDTVFDNNTVLNCDTTAISVQNTSDRVTITNNKMQGPLGVAISVASGGEGYLIANNHILDPGAQGILANGISGVIEGNYIESAGSDSIGVGIGSNVVVSDNVIKDGGAKGIHITDGALRVTLSCNTIEGCATEAIHFRSNANGPASECCASNNIINRISAAGNGIVITGGSDNIVAQNVVRGYSTAAIRIEDSGVPQVADNNMVLQNNVRGLVITDASTGVANDLVGNKT